MTGFYIVLALCLLGLALDISARASYEPPPDPRDRWLEIRKETYAWARRSARFASELVLIDEYESLELPLDREFQRRRLEIKKESSNRMEPQLP